MLPTDTQTPSQKDEDAYLDQIPDEVEMSVFDHLEELRMRIIYCLIAKEYSP